MSALASLGSLPKVSLKDIFLPGTYNEDGTPNKAGIYAVRLYSRGVPVIVTVDDYLPTVNGKLVFAKIPDGAIWVPILEKAFAKLYGNYEALNYNRISLAIEALLGAPVVDVAMIPTSEDSMLIDAISSGQRS